MYVGMTLPYISSHVASISRTCEIYALFFFFFTKAGGKKRDENWNVYVILHLVRLRRKIYIPRVALYHS